METPIPPIVDTHVHLWELSRFAYPWLDDPDCAPLRRDYLPGDLLAEAGDLDVRATVHVQAEMDHDIDPVEETAWLATLAATGRPAVPTVCVGYADLRAPDIGDVLDRHREHPLFRGVRQEAWFDPAATRADFPSADLLPDPRWRTGLRALAARDLTFDLLVLVPQLDEAGRLFRDLPELTVVLEHAGLPGEGDARGRWRQAMRRFAAQVPWAVLKISGLASASPIWRRPDVEAMIKEAIDLFGPYRCMFGSNFPVDRAAVSYRELWATYAAATADLDEDERTAIFSSTARRTYRIGV